MALTEQYQITLEAERQLQDNPIYATYDELVKELEKLNEELYKAIQEVTNMEKTYKQELYNQIQMLIGTGLKKTPAETEAKEQMRDYEYKIKELWNQIEFIKDYIHLAKYTLKKALLEFNKNMSEEI